MTDAQKAEYFDEWKDYFEPLARVRREVVKALPSAKRTLKPLTDMSLLPWKLSEDPEVKPELENLIQTMLNEVKSNDS